MGETSQIVYRVFLGGGKKSLQESVVISIMYVQKNLGSKHNHFMSRARSFS